MVFDWTVVSAPVTADFIIDVIIRPAVDQKRAWGLEFARVDGDHNRMPHARRTCIKTYKSCAAVLTDAAAVKMKKVSILMS